MAFSNFDDLSVSALTISEDDSTESWDMIIQGPDGATSSGDEQTEVTKNVKLGTNGKLKTSVNPSSNGGLIIENTKIHGYNSSGTKLLELVYGGTNEGDAYFGDYDGGNSGIKYDHSAGTLDYRGEKGDWADRVNMTAQEGCNVWLSSDQSISSSTDTKINFDRELWDTGNDFNTSNNRYTCDDDSKLLVSLHIITTRGDIGSLDEVAIMIFVNGTEVKVGGDLLPGAITDYNYPPSPLIAALDLDEGDYVELYTYQTATDNPGVDSSNNRSFCCIQKLA